MARYFFDHSVGVTIHRDETGTVCANDRLAMKCAWVAFPQILASAGIILPWQHFELVIRREDGAHVGRLGMTVIAETRNPALIEALALGLDGPERSSARSSRG